MIVIGLLTIWIIVGLNRLNAVKSRDMIIARSCDIQGSEMSILQYRYQDKTYKHIYQNNMNIPAQVPILVQKKHPDRYLFYTFWGFWNIGLVAGIFFSAVWLVYCQVIYARQDRITWMDTAFQRIQKAYERRRLEQ